MALILRASTFLSRKGNYTLCSLRLYSSATRARKVSDVERDLVEAVMSYVQRLGDFKLNVQIEFTRRWRHVFFAN